MTNEERIAKLELALTAAETIIGYAGFDSWEMECLGDTLDEFNTLVAVIRKDDADKEQEIKNKQLVEDHKIELTKRELRRQAIRNRVHSTLNEYIGKSIY